MSFKVIQRKPSSAPWCAAAGVTPRWYAAGLVGGKGGGGLMLWRINWQAGIMKLRKGIGGVQWEL